MLHSRLGLVHPVVGKLRRHGHPVDVGQRPAPPYVNEGRQPDDVEVLDTVGDELLLPDALLRHPAARSGISQSFLRAEQAKGRAAITRIEPSRLAADDGATALAHDLVESCREAIEPADLPLDGVEFGDIGVGALDDPAALQLVGLGQGSPIGVVDDGDPVERGGRLSRRHRPLPPSAAA